MDKFIKQVVSNLSCMQSCTYHSVLCQSCNENIHRDAINRAVRLQNHTKSNITTVARESIHVSNQITEPCLPHFGLNFPTTACPLCLCVAKATNQCVSSREITATMPQTSYGTSKYLDGVIHGPLPGTGSGGHRSARFGPRRSRAGGSPSP
jgi:hypothetical protein